MRIIILFWIAVFGCVQARLEDAKGKTNWEDVIFKQDLCDTVACREGEECILHHGVATCRCRRSCTHEQRFELCASDGQVYGSYCDLYRHMCRSGQKLLILNHGACPFGYSDNAKPVSPVVKTEKFAEIRKRVFRRRKISLPKIIPLSDSFNENWQWDELESIPTESFVTLPTIDIEFERLPKQVEKSQNLILRSDEQLREQNSSEKLPQNDSESLPSLTTDHLLVDNTTDMVPTGEPLKTSLSSAGTIEPEKCDDEDLVFLQNNLLLYFHAKFAESRDELFVKGKHFLVTLIYRAFDINSDNYITSAELSNIEKTADQYVNLLPVGCHLVNLIIQTDLDKDGKISRNEFFQAFGFKSSFLNGGKTVKLHEVKKGDQYQIFCDIHTADGDKIEWSRYGSSISEIAPCDFQVSKDGSSLYLATSTFIHSGNFTCKLIGSQTLEQTHIVKVYGPPSVVMHPEYRILKTGENSQVFCEVKDVGAFGKFRLEWTKNGKKLKTNSTMLKFTNAQMRDTGSFKCTILGDFGNATATASVVVRDSYAQPEKSLRDAQKSDETFAVLYQKGVRIFDAATCLLRKVLPSTHVSVELNRPNLCKHHKCKWSDAVVVGNYLYAALPKEKVVLIFDTKLGRISQLIPLSVEPVQLQYSELADTVFVTGKSGQSKSVLALNFASKGSKHSPTHAIQQNNAFLTVYELYVPKEHLMYGYAVSESGDRLLKVNLASLKVVKTVLLPNCRPQRAVFLNNGLVALYCEESKQLILDYCSDSILQTFDGIYGTPTLTPDGRTLYSIKPDSGKVFIQEIVDRNVSLLRAAELYFPLQSWTLLPDVITYGFDVAAVSPARNKLIEMHPDGTPKRISVIEVGKVTESDSLRFENSLISTRSADSGQFLISAVSRQNVTLFNTVYRHGTQKHKPQCVVENLNDISRIVWL